MKYFILLPLFILGGCLASLPPYQENLNGPTAKISFNDVSKGWYPFGKSLSIELYNGCATSRMPLKGMKENTLGKLTIKEADMTNKQFSIPANQQLYIWVGVPNGCGGPMALIPREGARYKAVLKSHNNVQCSIDIYETVNGEQVTAESARSIRRKGFLDLGDEQYSWRMCDHLESQ